MNGGALSVAEPERYAGAMRIANPMYDAAFKYLMDDDVSARLLVGAVLGEEVESLQPLPQERAVRTAPAPVPGEPPSGELLTVRGWTSRPPCAPPPATVCGCWWRCRRRASPMR